MENEVKEVREESAAGKETAEAVEPAGSAENTYQDLETVMLPTDDGELEYAILDYFDYQDRRYAICSPVEGDMVGDEVEIFRYRQNGDKVTMDIVDDRKTFNRIAEAYNKQLG